MMKTEATDLPKCWLTFYQLYGVTLRKTSLIKELPFIHCPADAVVTFPKFNVLLPMHPAEIPSK
jgi:hypothetical protein